MCGICETSNFGRMLCVEDAVVVNCEVSKQASTVCDKVGRSVRGLMNPSENLMPHLSQEAASCWQKIHFDDLANDAVDRKLRETKTANWCRTARSLIPLYISGTFWTFIMVIMAHLIDSFTAN